jgi:hypothetical protein
MEITKILIPKGKGNLEAEGMQWTNGSGYFSKEKTI